MGIYFNNDTKINAIDIVDTSNNRLFINTINESSEICITEGAFSNIIDRIKKIISRFMKFVSDMFNKFINVFKKSKNVKENTSSQAKKAEEELKEEAEKDKTVEAEPEQPEDNKDESDSKPKTKLTTGKGKYFKPRTKTKDDEYYLSQELKKPNERMEIEYYEYVFDDKIPNIECFVDVYEFILKISDCMKKQSWKLAELSSTFLRFDPIKLLTGSSFYSKNDFTGNKLFTDMHDGEKVKEVVPLSVISQIMTGDFLDYNKISDGLIDSIKKDKEKFETLSKDALDTLDEFQKDFKEYEWDRVNSKKLNEVLVKYESLIYDMNKYGTQILAAKLRAANDFTVQQARLLNEVKKFYEETKKTMEFNNKVRYYHKKWNKYLHEPLQTMYFN